LTLEQRRVENPMSPMQAAAHDTSLAEFRDQCRRQMQRKLEDRIKYGFCRIYKPALDDAPYRVFQTMAEYRAWCEASLPAYLGFRQASDSRP
jgi:hypothetical protein